MKHDDDKAHDDMALAQSSEVLVQDVHKAHDEELVQGGHMAHDVEPVQDGHMAHDGEQGHMAHDEEQGHMAHDGEQGHMAHDGEQEHMALKELEVQDDHKVHDDQADEQMVLYHLHEEEHDEVPC